MSESFTSQPFGSQVASQRRRRPRCPQCGSNRFRRDPGTSLVVCDSGHVLQGFRDEEAQDGDEYNSNRTQMHRRSLKRQGIERNRRVGRKRMSVATKGVWYGARSRYLYFQALQLILRMQIQALLREIPGLPEEIEPICRDLWALYVSQKADLVAQPFVEQIAATQTGEADAESSLSIFRRSAQAERDAILEQEREESERLREQMEEIGVFEEERDEFASHSDATTDRRATDSEWESALDQDDDEDDKNNVFAPKKRRRPARKASKIARNEGKVLQRRSREDLDDLLSILYLALITLRIPLTWTDLCTLIRAGKLPYLNIVHQLPHEMVMPFPAREVRKLDPTRVPSIQKLHRRTAALATDLYEAYGIEFPELNSLPILWRFVERMLLPPTFYTATKALLAYVDVPMHTVPPHNAARPHLVDTSDLESYSRNIQPALDGRLSVNLGKKSTAREIIIMAALVVMTKMRYGLDGEERHENFEDPLLWSGAPDLQEWLSSLQLQESNLLNDHQAIYEARGLDLLDMDESQLDAYLDYAERTLILSQRPSAYKWRRREGIDDLLSSVAHLHESYALNTKTAEDNVARRDTILSQKRNNVEERLDELYNEKRPWIPPYVSLTSNQPRPGDAHSIYSAKETIQSLFSDYVSVLHHASSIVGCQEAEMIDTVHAVEFGLIKTLIWRRKTREAAERQRVRQEQGSKKPGRPRKVASVNLTQEQEIESTIDNTNKDTM